ncbi:MULTISPECIES: hypothetical protein [unclassified Endozoicomonas]|uniref:hypothetical protein n=1 Tax=unclassified Endozoicomonas TaxID=2644528 RepID=UPI003BB813CA
MDVAQGTGTSASPYPPSQSKFDTPSVKASGRWALRKSTSKLLPNDRRESARQELLHAAESGRLAFRRIELTEEKNNFSGKGAPRPFTLALPGKMAPTGTVSERCGRWMVGVVNPQCLHIYKRDANTQQLAWGTGPNQLGVKQLPDLQSLHDRLLERADKIVWGVYPRFTSGHLQADGTFSLPKLKLGDGTFSADYPELVLTKYGKEDIKCFCVYNDAQINIADILLDKHQCEKEFQLDPLPLVVYCHRTGSVQVYFDDELDSKRLARNEHSLNDFAFSLCLAPEHFRALLNLLPMSSRAVALSSKLTDSTKVMGKLQQAIKLVRNPRFYSYEKLLKLKQSGLPIHQSFIHHGSVRSLLDMLLLSEACRNSEPEHEQTGEQEKEACRLLKLLLQSGAGLERTVIQHIASMGSALQPVMPTGVINYLVAAFAPFDFLTLKHLSRIPLTGCPGSVVEFDRICKGLGQEQLKQYMKEVISDAPSYSNLDMHRQRLLALFRYGDCPDKKILLRLKGSLEWSHPEGKKVIDDFSVADYIQWVDELWKHRETHPFYQNWSKHVQQAKQDIRELKRSLDPGNSHNLATPSAAITSKALRFMVDAFNRPPVMPDHTGDNEKTILKVLQHYYRRPGPERVIQSLHRKTMPTVWKPLHSCSHVLRARNNGHWYMELLNKFQQRYFSEEEKELLSLAIIYHDAAAEDVDKTEEETSSAEYFKRDLTGRYPAPLLADMAEAMINKENDVKGKDQQNLSVSVRWYLRILRFADRTDVIRGCGVGADFPGLTATRTRGFNAGLLDLPTQLTEDFTSGPDNKSEFQRHLEAAMHGAADLARVTGRLHDQRNKDYTKVYGLIGNGSKISENFEWTTEPVQRMDQFIDDNVRRKIAKEAGIVVCSDPSHQACKADQNKGITYGIHNSGYDLAQVKIPAEMTLLEKMQYEHDPSLLSPATQQAIEREVQRLKSEGIRMNPGTLTQETLTSEEARKVLKERGIAVVSEQHPYFTRDGLPGKREMLVPKKMAVPDAQSTPAEEVDPYGSEQVVSYTGVLP